MSPEPLRSRPVQVPAASAADLAALALGELAALLIGPRYAAPCRSVARVLVRSRVSCAAPSEPGADPEVIEGEFEVVNDE